MGTWPGNPPCRYPNCDCGIQGCGQPGPEPEPNWRSMYYELREENTLLRQVAKQLQQSNELLGKQLDEILRQLET